MISMLLINWKYVVIAALMVALSVTMGLYLKERDKLAALTATVRSLGEQAEKIIEEKKLEAIQNLTSVKEDYESKVPEIRSNAVANYIAQHPTVRVRKPIASSCSMSATASSIPLDDGAVEESVPDPAFIENAAEDVAKLGAWQEWCKLNHCPIKVINEH